MNTPTPAMGDEKTAVETRGDMGYDMYNKASDTSTYYGNAKNGLRSDGFMRLENNDDDEPNPSQDNSNYNAARGYPPPPPHIPPQQQNPYPPYIQPVEDKRGLLTRALLGPVRRPWFSWLSGVAMLIVLVIELVKNSQLTGSVIETNPFNVMIGPSFSVSMLHVNRM